MTIRLFQRRSIWWPTLSGWAFFLITAGVPFLLWCWQGESFLARTERLPANILVVEGWIGIEGIRAAKAEFDQGGYRYVVATGGMSGNRWDTRQESLAVEAEALLLRLGLSRDQVILAKPQDVQNHRTFASAVAVWQSLHASGIESKSINLFSLGCHARRSRLVFAKVLRPDTEVGVVSWTPPGYNVGPWWQSSDRSLDLLKETVGILFEFLLNSGRTSNSPLKQHPESLPGQPRLSP